MAYDAHKNFAYSTVATAPSTPTAGTSLVVQSGNGALFPTAPFNATIWPSGAQPTSSNAEIVRVTNISTDTFTITRAQEGSSAQSVAIGFQIAATITVKTFTDIEQGTLRMTNRQGGTTGNNTWASTGTSNTDISGVSAFSQVGSLAVNANPTTLTFPVTFNQVPLLHLTCSSSNSVNAMPQYTAISVTTATLRMVHMNSPDTIATTETVSWQAIGQ